MNNLELIVRVSSQPSVGDHVSVEFLLVGSDPVSKPSLDQLAEKVRDRISESLAQVTCTSTLRTYLAGTSWIMGKMRMVKSTTLFNPSSSSDDTEDWAATLCQDIKAVVKMYSKIHLDVKLDLFAKVGKV